MSQSHRRRLLHLQPGAVIKKEKPLLVSLWSGGIIKRVQVQAWSHLFTHTHTDTRTHVRECCHCHCYNESFWTVCPWLQSNNALKHNYWASVIGVFSSFHTFHTSKSFWLYFPFSLWINILIAVLKWIKLIFINLF